MPKKLADGTMVSKHSQSALYTGKIIKNNTIILKAIIKQILYKDSENNPFPHQVTYRVEIIERFMQGIQLIGVEDATVMLSGPYNFSEVIRTPAKLLINGKVPSFSDKIGEFGVGDIVLISFRYGDFRKPIIIGVLPSRLSIQTAMESDGLRILGEYNGVRWNINKDGELIITYNGGQRDVKTGIPVNSSTGPTQIKVDKAGNFSIIDNLNQIIKIDRVNKKINITAAGDAKIIIDGASNKIQIQSATVEIGDATLEFIVKATKLKNWLNNKIKTIFNAHIHNTGVGPSSVPTTTMDTVSESDMASSKHYVE